MKLWKKNLLLVALAVLITAFPIIVLKDSEFMGTDSQVEGAVAELNAEYTPWAESWFTPSSSEVESMLFALQAAIGGCIVGFGFGRLSARYEAQ